MATLCKRPATLVCFHVSEEVHKRQDLSARFRLFAHPDLCPRVKVFNGKCPICASTIVPKFQSAAKGSRKIFVCSTGNHHFVLGCGKSGCKMAKGGVLQQLWKISGIIPGVGNKKKEKQTPVFFKAQCLTCNCDKPYTYCSRCALFLPHKKFIKGQCVAAFAAAAATTADSVGLIAHFLQPRRSAIECSYGLPVF